MSSSLEDEDALSELMVASQHSDTQRALALLGACNDQQARNALVRRHSPKLKLTAAHLAAYNGSSDIVEALLANGADPLAANSEGDTPLLLAAHTGHAALVQQMLTYVATTSRSDSVPKSDAASASASSASASPLDLASVIPRAHAAVWAAICHTSNEGMHMLLYACEGGHADTVALLLETARQIEAAAAAAATATGAATTTTTTTTTTTADGAVTAATAALYSPSLVALVNQRNHGGSAALHFSIAAGEHATVLSLLEAGADACAATDDGFCPLLLAVQEGDVRTVEVLLRHGADPNAVDAWSQNTALHCALEGGPGFNEIVCALLAPSATRACDLTASNREALTPLMLARSLHNEMAVEMLQEYERARGGVRAAE